MLNPKDNERLTQTGPGTPMGKMLREYWWPVLRSDAVVPDGAPVRVRLLGENFVAWRDTEGRLGLLDEHCPHRRVSLMLARNEECGLRCIMHGWKIDVNGKVIETPNEVDAGDRMDRIRVRSYQVREAGKLIWAYIGDKKTPPPFPKFLFNDAVAVEPLICQINCNWFQVMETLWDPAHLAVLHCSEPALVKAYEGTGNISLQSDKPQAIRFDGQRTEPWGFRYRVAEGCAPDTGGIWTPTVMPCWVFISAVARTEDADRVVFAHTPIDDTHMLMMLVSYNLVKEFGPMGRVNTDAVGSSKHNFRLPTMDPATVWGQDRMSMLKGSFSGLGVEYGVVGVLNQDVAVAESMGAISDRSREHLGPADHAVIKGRQVYLEALAHYEATGEVLGLHYDMSKVGGWQTEEWIEPALAAE